MEGSLVFDGKGIGMIDPREGPPESALRQGVSPWLANILIVGRDRRIFIGIASGVMTKGLGFFLTLISVPLTLHHLGPERYGVWVTMLSMLAWISMVDLGIANGLTPALTAALGREHEGQAQQYVATAFWGLFGIAILAGSIIWASWKWIRWDQIFNLKDTNIISQLPTAIAFAIGIFLVSLPFSLNQRILLAEQKGFVANIWAFASNIFGVFGIFIVTKIHGNIILLSIGYLGSQLLVSIICFIWLFWKANPRLHPFVVPNPSEARHIFALGGLFFLNQFSTLIIFQKDNLLITHILGPMKATPFSVTWQILMYLNIINILVGPYLGPAYGEAFVKGDIPWIRKVFFRHLLFSCGVTTLLVFLYLLFYNSILIAWVGKEVVPTLPTVAWLGLLTVVLSIQFPITILLNHIGHIKLFTVCYGIAALVNIFSSIILIKKFGPAGGAIASIGTLVMMVIIPSLWEIYYLLSKIKK